MSTKVLVIDDAPHIRRLIARMLTMSDFESLEAANGREGLQMLKKHHPDIVTCDISMPVMDGFEFLEAVRQDSAVAKVPIIVITAIGQEEETTRARQLGANACLTKPFSSSHLVEVIEDLLKQ